MEKRYVFAILAVLLGGFGIQEFALGNTVRGILGILTCWTGIPAIIALVQIIKALLAKSDEEFFANYPNNRME